MEKTSLNEIIYKKNHLQPKNNLVKTSLTEESSRKKTISNKGII